MKTIINFFYFTIFIFLVSSPAHAAPSQVQPQPEEWVSGKQWTKHIVEAYVEGKYVGFLQKLNAHYEELLKDEQWQSLFMAEKLLQNPETYEILKQESGKSFKEFVKLAKETQQQLSEVANRYPDLMISSIIHDVITNELTNDEQEDLQLFADLNYSPNKAEEGTLLAKLQEIVRESQVKNSILYMTYQKISGATDLNFIDKSELSAYAVIIRLSTFQKMFEASQYDKTINPQIFKAYLAYLKKTASSHDWKYLESFGNGTRSPANEGEEQIATIMKAYISNKKLLKFHMIGNAWERLGIEKDPQKI